MNNGSCHARGRAAAEKKRFLYRFSSDSCSWLPREVRVLWFFESLNLKYLRFKFKIYFFVEAKRDDVDVGGVRMHSSMCTGNMARRVPVKPTVVTVIFLQTMYKSDLITKYLPLDFF